MSAVTQKCKNILLDWDGCLAKTLDIWLDAYLELSHSLDIYPTEREVVENAFGKWEEGPKSFGVKDPKKFILDLLRIVNQKFPHVELYPGVSDTLKRLKESGRKIALVTSSKKGSVGPALSNLKIKEVFDALLAKEDVKNFKPDPEIIHKTLTLLNADPKESIIVGDSPHDIQAGKNAGITTVLFFPKENERFYREEDLIKENPDYFIRDFEQLLNLV